MCYLSRASTQIFEKNTVQDQISRASTQIFEKNTVQDQGSTQIARELGALGAREALCRTVPVLARFQGGEKNRVQLAQSNFLKLRRHYDTVDCQIGPAVQRGAVNP